MIVIPRDAPPEQIVHSFASLKSAFFFVMVLTFICFIPDLNNSLLDWDDSGYVTNNVQIRTLSFETIRWAFTTFYCNYWTPLTWISLAVDYSFTGLNPTGYHLTNNIIHSFNAGIFFLVCYQLMQRHLESTDLAGGETFILTDKKVSCSILAALIFALHPLRVESVVWATERKDVLGLFFGLLAVLAYLHYVRTLRAEVPSASRSFSFLSSRYYWVVLALFALSLLSKAMFVTFPVVLLVLDWFPLGRLSRRAFRDLLPEKIPFLILSGLAAVLTMQATAATRVTYADVSLLSRALIVFKSLTTYLQLFVWPVDISPIYLNPGNISIDFRSVISIVLIIAITLFCFIRIRRQPLFLATWLLFLIPLSPMLSVSGIHAMADRFTYLPGLSISFLSALGIVSFYNKYASSRRMTISIMSGTFVLLVCLASITVRDTAFWKNDITLWSRVIELEPHKFGMAYFQRSLFLYRTGEYQQALSDVNEAVLIASRKGYAGYEIYAQRAAILKKMKDYEGALADLDRAIELSQGMFADVYAERGDLHRILGNSERAKADFRAAGLPNGIQRIEQ